MKLRKILTAGVAAVMVLAMTACGGDSGKKDEKVSLDGTWTALVDRTETFGAIMDESMQDSENIKFSQYLPKMELLISFITDDEGNYEFGTETVVDRAAFKESYFEYLSDVLAEENGGVPLTDEEIEETLGADMETATAEFFSAEALEDLFGYDAFTGTFTEEKGIITLDDGTTGTFDGKKVVLDLSVIDYGEVEFTKK